MENISLKSIINGLTADINELEKFINESKRPNVRRSLEEQLKIIKKRRDESQSKLDVSIHSEIISNNNNTNTNINTNVNSNNNYESVNKYSFDAGDKFVK